MLYFKLSVSIQCPGTVAYDFESYLKVKMTKINISVASLHL